jgi:hypothetical protein
LLLLLLLLLCGLNLDDSGLHWLTLAYLNKMIIPLTFDY